MSSPRCLDCGGEMQLVLLPGRGKRVLRCPWVTRADEEEAVGKGVAVMFCRKPFARSKAGEMLYEGPPR